MGDTWNRGDGRHEQRWTGGHVGGTLFTLTVCHLISPLFIAVASGPTTAATPDSSQAQSLRRAARAFHAA